MRHEALSAWRLLRCKTDQQCEGTQPWLVSLVAEWSAQDVILFTNIRVGLFLELAA